MAANGEQRQISLREILHLDFHLTNRNLSAAKKNSVGLNYGDFTSVLLTNKQCIFKRATENETVYVCINAEENAFDAYCEVKNHTYTDLITNTPMEIGECFKMPGYSAFYLMN